MALCGVCLSKQIQPPLVYIYELGLELAYSIFVELAYSMGQCSIRGRNSPNVRHPAQMTDGFAQTSDCV